MKQLEPDQSELLIEIERHLITKPKGDVLEQRYSIESELLRLSKVGKLVDLLNKLEAYSLKVLAGSFQFWSMVNTTHPTEYSNVHAYTEDTWSIAVFTDKDISEAIVIVDQGETPPERCIAKGVGFT